MARTSSYPLGNYIPALLSLGVSASSALDFARPTGTVRNITDLEALRASDLAFLENSGGVRRQNFLWQWGAIAAQPQLREQLQAQELAHVPIASELTQLRYPRARGIQTNVDVLVRDLRSGAEYFTPMAVVTANVLAHGEAIVRAAANLRSIQTQHHLAGNRDTLPFQILNAGIVTDVIERLPELDEVEGL